MKKENELKAKLLVLGFTQFESNNNIWSKGNSLIHFGQNQIHIFTKKNNHITKNPDKVISTWLKLKKLDHNNAPKQQT